MPQSRSRSGGNAATARSVRYRLNADARGQQPRLPTRKTSLLLAALALAGERGFRREALAELVWPDRAEAQARASLRQALTAVRKLLATADGSLSLAADAETVRLAGPDTAIDARAFDRLADSSVPDDLVRAAELCQGELLEGLALDGPLERWVSGYRAAFHRRALGLAERLGALAQGDDAAGRAAERLAERLLARDPAAEEAHRALIRVLLARGHRNAARRQLEQCREALRRELDAAPEPATVALLEQGTGEMPAAQSATRALRETGTAIDAPPPPPRSSGPGPSVVVMPFDNLSGPDNEPFVDGVVEDITAALSRIREFFVVARQSAFTYKGRFVDVREVSRELGVRYVIEGTVRRDGDRVRITVQLIEATGGAHLWAEKYDGALDDIFDLQDRITERVAGALQPSIRLAEIERARRKRPQDLGAYDYTMRAMRHVWMLEKDECTKGLELLEKALEIDPDYHLALALAAWCHAQRSVYNWTADAKGSIAEALGLAERAAHSGGDEPLTLTVLGTVHALARNHETARLILERAIAIDPNSSWAWSRLGWLDVYTNRPDSAEENFQRSIRLSPLDPMIFNNHAGLGAARAVAMDYEGAVEHLQRALRERPGAHWIRRMLAACLVGAGRMDEARAMAEEIMRYLPDFTIRGYVDALPGWAGYKTRAADFLRRLGLPE